MKILNLIFLLSFFATGLKAQSCTVFGQTPATAFPVCAENVFEQKTVPICNNGAVFVPGCTGAPNAPTYEAKNPFWYRFTCYESGTLSLLITPKDLNDDYDWQLYDVTGLEDLNDIINANSGARVVTGNWAGTPGETGANPNSEDIIRCASNPVDNIPTFTKSPELTAGHEYLLLVSHYTESQSGYDLSFEGSRAKITQDEPPAIEKIIPSCDGSELVVQFNKEMQCSSLAGDGSDFSISTGGAQVISAEGEGCETGFGMTEVTLKLDQMLPDGTYDLEVKEGSDENTLLDFCGKEIPEGTKIPFTIDPVAPTLIDRIEEVSCAPNSIEVVFEDNIRMETIASDGSDFALSGPDPVTVSKASGIEAENGLTKRIRVEFSTSIQNAGTYTLTVQKGSDNNSVLNECGAETTAGHSIDFETADTVRAEILSDVTQECNLNTIQLSNPGGNGIQDWTWTIGTETSHLQDFSYSDTTFKSQEIQLTVSNGVCTDTRITTLDFDQGYFVQADFSAPEFACPEDLVTFSDSSLGEILSYRWDFGNGETSFQQNPPEQQYPEVNTRQDFFVFLEVETTKGCRDSAEKRLEVLNSCYIAVPSAFSPNGDGQNDYLYPLNAYKAEDLTFRVYNRWGKMVFESHDWSHKWDGKFNGENQPIGSYVWYLEYIDPQSGERIFKKGASLLLR